MPRRDIYHQCVLDALYAAGWTVTHDPFPLSFGGRDLYVDVGAESPIGAERAGKTIAVEIKSFIGPSDMHELGNALGQYVLYRTILTEIEPSRSLFLAIPGRIYDALFRQPIGQLIVDQHDLHLAVFDEQTARFTTWRPLP